MVRDDATSWPLGSERPSLHCHMDFVIEQVLPGTPDAIEGVLLDSAFVEARATLPKLGDPELLESVVDGTTARQRTRFRFTGDLSSAVTAVIDADKLTWVDDATYDLLTHTADHRIVPDHYADRLRCTYRATITADGGGSTRSLDGSLKVRMMLVGSKVEGAIVSGLREYAAAEAELLGEWLRR
jgi:hypothetical protein